MAILLTGGTGKTSTHLAKLLQDANIQFLLTSRKGQAGAPSGMEAVKFDWDDASTYKAPFQHKFPNGETIKAVYLISPQSHNASPLMISFVDIAIKHGVKRVVMLTGSETERNGGIHSGSVWQHLEDSGVEYCVLRATWFMENLTQWQHIGSIKNEGKIYSACGDGKVPFVSVADIAAVAFYALTVEKLPSTDYRVLGPELLTHDQLAEKLSKGLDRKIENVKLTKEESAQRWSEVNHAPEPLAQFMARLESLTADKREERTNNVVEKVTGRPPMTFDAFVQENKSVWG
ncbi:NAD(P)-binding protein [Hyaloscypha variabilis]